MIRELAVGDAPRSFRVVFALNLALFLSYFLYESLDHSGVLSGRFDSAVLFITAVFSLSIILLSGVVNAGLLNGIVASLVILGAELALLFLGPLTGISIVDRVTASAPTLTVLFVGIGVVGYAVGRGLRIVYNSADQRLAAA
jgi:hypothetical protein